MKYLIERSGPVPAYIQLYRQVREDIVSGVCPYGSKLPSKRNMADETGVSTVTVEHAYAILCDEGYIEPRERSGYVVIFRADDGFVSSAEGEKEIGIPQRYSTPTEFPFTVLARTMRAVISEYGESILDRSPNSGNMELRTAISLYLARSRGIDAAPDQIIIGSGAEYLYRLAAELLGRGRLYAIESPSYKKIELVYRTEGLDFEVLPLGKDGIDSEALAESKASVLHISPYRSFPSGVTASASKRHEYLRWAERGDRYMIEDDFESEFSVSRKPEETLFAHSAKNNVIYMNTFSKTISPALRVGYMVLPKGLTGVFNEKLGFCSCTVPTFEQLVLARLINGGDFERHINRVRRKKRRELTGK